MGIGVAKAQVQFPHPPQGSATQCTNGWQLAEANDDADPYGIQYLLNRAAAIDQRLEPPCAATCRITWGLPNCGDHQRDRVPEEGDPLDRGGAAAQRRGRWRTAR